MNKNYIKDIRKKVNHDPIILTFAGGILTNYKNEILLQKRSDFKSWGLPGGALEFGETAPAACKREFLEETGLEVEIQSLVGISTNQIQKYPNGDLAQTIVVFFLVNLVERKSNKLSNETLEINYFSKNKLPNIFNKQHLKCINKYYERKFPYYD